MSSLLADGATPIFHLVHPASRTLGPYGIVTDIRFHPVPLVALVAVTFLYLRAVRRVDRPGGARIQFGAAAPLRGGAGATGPDSPTGRVQAWAAGTAPWPRWRTWSFLAAVLTMAVASLSGLDAFERSSFSIVGTQDALLAFVAPFFLALSAPVTLAVEAAGPERGERIRAAFTGRAARVLSYPLVAAAIWGGFLFLLYFTPLFRQSLDHPALWQAVELLLVLTGCLFAWPMAAIDPLPKVVGHGWRMLWLLLTLPYTTILGMSLESETKGLAPGVTKAEVHTGGGILWTLGGFLGLFATILVLVSWCRLEERSARRRDRTLDPEAAAQLAYWKANRRLAAEEAGLIPRSETDQLAAETLALQGAPTRLALPAGTAPAAEEPSPHPER